MWWLLRHTPAITARRKTNSEERGGVRGVDREGSGIRTVGEERWWRRQLVKQLPDNKTTTPLTMADTAYLMTTHMKHDKTVAHM